MVTWNWGFAISYMIPQMQRNIWRVYKFLNVEIIRADDIIYDSRTKWIVGEVEAL